MKSAKYVKKRTKSDAVNEPVLPYESSNRLTFEKVWLMFQETDKKFQETDRQVKETDKKFQETDKKMRALQELFTGQWGKLVEALLAPGCVKLFKDAGIKIEQAFANATSQKGGGNMEIDVLLVNTDEVVVIEIKTTAKVVHVKELLNTMAKFRDFFPQYKAFKIYGAIAALRFTENCATHATKKGLFVIEPHGEGMVRLKNTKGFKAKKF